MEALPPKTPSVFDFEPDQLDQLVASWGWPKFRGKQIRQWVYTRRVLDPQLMTDLSQLDRNTLAERIDFSLPTIDANQLSQDGTHKLLLSWPGKTPDDPRPNAETVMIPDDDRRTACVSSQVGCPVGCTFCASGVGGVKGNLTTGQIVQQIWMLGQPLAKKNERINHVVFMGMGEPLANYQPVMSAARIMNHLECFGISARKITLSTVGVPPKMRELAKEGLPINLAISLHAPNEKLRRQLIPWANHFQLDDILDAARDYFDKTGREITLEYILLSGVNDRPEHARELSLVVKSLRANVNLLRYNEVEGLGFKRPVAQDVVRFQDVLRSNGINAHVRKSRGRDIDAACGQLRKKQQDLPTTPPTSPTSSISMDASAPTPVSVPLTISSTSPSPRAFTLLEMMVVLGMLSVLIGILLPYLLSVREQGRRTACADNLRDIGLALSQYADINANTFPRTRISPDNPDRWTAFTGPDAPNPFSDSAPNASATNVVAENDVTASLWLLVRYRLAKTEQFVCPSSSVWRDPLVNAADQAVGVMARSNFRSADHLGYSYASPFSSAPGYRADDSPPSQFARLADRNPGFAAGQNVTAPKHNDSPINISKANSLNHGRAGQNVLFADGHVSFHSTPFCGYGQDNIYTSLSAKILRGETPPATEPGILSQDIGPVWRHDSVLLPAEQITPPSPTPSSPTTPSSALQTTTSTSPN